MNLCTAAHQGKIDVLSRLLAEGHPIDERCGGKDRPLKIAAESRRASVDVLKFLVEAGAAVNEVRGTGILGHASNPEKARYLMSVGADPLAQDRNRYSVLFETIRKELDQVKLILDAGADPNVVTQYRETIIDRALDFGKPGAFELLLEYGANPEVAKWTPAMIAMATGDADALRAECRKGIDLKRFDRDSTLYFAFRRGSPDMVNILIEFGADPRVVGEEGETALAVAADYGRVEAIRWLVAMGADPNGTADRQGDPLRCALRCRRDEAVVALLELGAEVSRMDYPFVNAGLKLETLDLLLNHGANIDVSYGEPLLREAIDDGDLDLLKAYVDRGADLHYYGGAPPLAQAATEDELEFLQYLLDIGADPNFQDCDSETALHRAGSAEAVQMLLDRGANPRIANCVGQWPHETVEDPAAKKLLETAVGGPPESELKAREVWEAIVDGDAARLERMLHQGYDANLAREGYWPPLSAAAALSRIDCLEVLLRAGANIEAKTLTGWTALHAVFLPPKEDLSFFLDIFNDRVDLDEIDPEAPMKFIYREGTQPVIRRLIEAGANLEARTSEGMTPLLLACAQGKPEDVAFLLESGADSTAVSLEGLGAIDLAKEHRTPDFGAEIRDLLEKRRTTKQSDLV